MSTDTEPPDSRAQRDSTDLVIIRHLQRDARVTLTALGKEVGLTPPAVHGRLRRMQNAGVITGFSTTLDHVKLGFGLSVQISVSLVGYHPDLLEEFCQAVLREPSIVECYLLTGGTDFLLRAVARDVKHLRVLLSSVIGRLPHVRTFESDVILDTIKYDYSVLASGDPESD